MPTTPPGHLALPPPAFPQGGSGSAQVTPPSPSRQPGTPRKSFGSRSYRQAVRAKFDMHDEELGDDLYSVIDDKAPIPSAIPKENDTPLPILPMVVLCIAMLGEFLSANVSTPFLLPMVEGFGVEKSQVGSSTGLLVSAFFITQFLTSILWATIADKHGRRSVLFLSLLGSSLTCAAFGTARSFPEAITIRLMQGIFGGSIGVARGAVAAITDSTNEARAYAQIGFCWGLGGVAGAVIGGAFESPAVRWPNGIGGFPLFVRYPYLLPCGIAASITFTGAILSLFLGWDGGSREGLIRLPPEKDDLPVVTELQETSSRGTQSGSQTPEEGVLHQPETMVDRVMQQTKDVRKRVSGYFARRVRDAYGLATPSPAGTPLMTGNRNMPIPGSAVSRTRTLSSGHGSAYGYSRGMRSRLASSVGAGKSPGGALRRRRLTGQSYAEGEAPEELSFAQRLLLANEGNVTSMANLWVAAAINTDMDDPFFDDSTDDEGPPPENAGVDESESVFYGEDEASRPATPAASAGRVARASTRPSFGSSVVAPRPRPSFGGFAFGPLTQISAPSPLRPQRDMSPSQNQTPRVGTSQLGTPRIGYRRGSSTSNIGLPAIYNNTGLSSPPALAQDLQPFFEDDRAHGHGPNLSVISEGSGSVTDVPSFASQSGHKLVVDVTPTPSLWSQLPFIIIFQYGLLALHNTVHDQYFLSYLVSPYNVGGLGLNPAHFAQLIALMCLAQIFYQFYLYPNVGPPRGRWSHLAMFRIGSALFIPSYMSVILYRAFARESEDGNFIVMALLTFSTALRFCGTTFTYTAIAILLNYMSPPHLVSLSNSIGQSTVALARFIGPIMGGYLWSASIRDGPGGYPYGFYLVSGVCAVAILHSFTIR